MKRLLYYISLFLCTALIQACDNDDVNTGKSIFEDPIIEDTEFDTWILSNFAYPYNISFKYRMEDLESDMDFQLAPAEPEKAQIMAKLLKYLWLEVYDEHVGVNFTRSYVPRVIHLIGSGGHNSSGTVRLGSAEGGMKITLYRINELNASTITGVKINENYMKTVHHEFAHILHQTKNYPEEFQHITGTGYIQNEWSASNNSEELALESGFISRYSRKEPNEDFVEIFAHFITRPDGWWEGKLVEAGEEGADLIEKKFEMVKDYMRDSWEIDIFELRDIVQRRSNDVKNLDFENLN